VPELIEPTTALDTQWLAARVLEGVRDTAPSHIHRYWIALSA
jgi:hypothetical protein